MSSVSFDVVEISSGVHDETLWVSVGFSSELERLDVLHFVCATEVDSEDRKLGQNEMYLERFDQAYSCYAGADEIRVMTSKLQLKLNARGCKSLAFPQEVQFVVASKLSGWADAQRIFKRMESLECGRVLRAA
jgi:hypothetical protein